MIHVLALIAIGVFILLGSFLFYQAVTVWDDKRSLRFLFGAMVCLLGCGVIGITMSVLQGVGLV